MTDIAIDRQLYATIVRDGDWHLFCRWLSIKYLFGDSCIHNSDFHNVARRLKISERTVRNCQKKFLERGWACFDNHGHLRLASLYEIFRNLRKEGKIRGTFIRRTIKINIYGPLSQIRAVLNTLLLERVIASRNPAHCKEYHRGDKEVKPINTSVSGAYLSKVYGEVSKSTVSRIKKSMADMGLIQVEKQEKLLEAMVCMHKIPHYKANMHQFPAGTFFRNLGDLVQRLPDKITLLVRPVMGRRIPPTTKDQHQSRTWRLEKQCKHRQVVLRYMSMHLSKAKPDPFVADWWRVAYENLVQWVQRDWDMNFDTLFERIGNKSSDLELGMEYYVFQNSITSYIKAMKQYL